MGEWYLLGNTQFTDRGIFILNTAWLFIGVVMEVAMFTYLLIGIPFISTVLVLDVFVLKTKVITKRDTWIVMGVMMLLTLVFDQLLTGLPIVFYDSAKQIGVKLGYAPIEDFTYTFAVVVLVGSILNYGKTKKHHK